MQKFTEDCSENAVTWIRNFEQKIKLAPIIPESPATLGPIPPRALVKEACANNSELMYNVVCVKWLLLEFICFMHSLYKLCNRLVLKLNNILTRRPSLQKESQALSCRHFTSKHFPPILPKAVDCIQQSGDGMWRRFQNTQVCTQHFQQTCMSQPCYILLLFWIRRFCFFFLPFTAFLCEEMQ